MKNFHTLIGILLSLTMITLISGCGGGGSSSFPATASSGSGSGSDSTGTLSLFITDAKPRLDENATAVNIRIIAIEYGHDDGWTEVEGFEPLTINLMDWQDGRSIQLGEFKLPVGSYKEIRFQLAIAEKEGDVKSNPDCYITFKNALPAPLFAPSGGTSGYKGKGDFDITTEAPVAVVADWDAGRAIVVTGNGKHILHPVIQLSVIELSGEIKGTVVDVAEVEEYGQADDALVVYAYEDGIYADYEWDINEDEVRFPKAFSSSDVNMTDGNFTFYFLGEGNYTLVTAHYESDIFSGVVDIDTAEVFKNETALVELNTSDPIAPY